MLKIDHLQKRYSDFSLDCSLEVKKGCITGLIGQNGAGKSTTFKAILGLISKDGGNLTLLGKNIEDFTAHDREDLGVVLSDSSFSGYLTPKDYIPVLKQMYPDFQEDYLLKQMHKMNLPFDKKLKDFSTGMKAKFKVITALSHQAKFLLLDEPTKGIDNFFKLQFARILKRLNENGVTIIMVSHDVEFCARYADLVSMFFDGNITDSSIPLNCSN